jgi:hypothetical protein
MGRHRYSPIHIISRVKVPLYPLDRRLGGSRSKPVGCEEENNLLPMSGIEPGFVSLFSP